MSVTPDNNVVIRLRLFDTVDEVKTEFGKYENVPLVEVSPDQLLTDIRKAFYKTLKQFETDIKILKEGNG
jgi:hypothetical protein